MIENYKWSYFENYLYESGFRPNRLIYNNKTKDFYYKPGYFSISTQEEGGLNHVWIKDSVMVTYGLNECGLPPTIVSPRPVGYIKKDNCIEYFSEIRDFQMHNILKKCGNEKTLELILSKKQIDLTDYLS